MGIRIGIIVVGFVGLMFGFASVLALYLSVRAWRDRFKLRQDGVTVEGHITERNTGVTSNPEGPDVRWYNVRYSYDYQGQTYSREERVSEKYYRALSEGTPVPVLCVAHDPTVARVADPTTGSIVNKGSCSIVLGLVLGVIGFGLTICLWLLLIAWWTQVL